MRKELVHIVALGLMFYMSSQTVSAQTPTTAAPVPTCPPGQVISLYSDTYTDVPVTSFLAPWSPPPVFSADLVVAGNNYKYYGAVTFFGIETLGANLIDASGMTSFHFDLWTPNMTSFTIKLVDFGANGVFGGGDDSEHEIIIYNPSQSEWLSYEIFLFDFPSLTSTSNIAQIIFSGIPAGSSAICLDNIYFSTCNNQIFPFTAAPSPVTPAADVISMFSDVYTDVPVNTFLTPWSQAPVTLTNTMAAGNPIKCYQDATFLGIEFSGANIINASGMNYLHLDVWTPNMHTVRVKLVDFGPNLVFGGGDDTEHEIDFHNFPQETWVGLDILLSDFTTLSSTNHLAQLILSGTPKGTARFYMDNLYFSTSSSPLPVELISFTAESLNNEAALLKWSTASEVNSHYFQVERSGDGEHFESIGIVQSAGNSSSVINYEYKDVSPLDADNYYRLKQVDFDGAYEYFDVRHLSFGSEEQAVMVYPNPTTDYVHLTLPGPGPATVTLYSQSGAKMHSWSLNGSELRTNRLSLDRVPLGLYLLSVEQGGKQELLKLGIK